MTQRSLLFTALLAVLPCMLGCNLVQAKKGKMPFGPIKKISIGRLDLQVPVDAELQMTGQVKEVKLSTDHLESGTAFAAAWHARVKKIASGSGNDPQPRRQTVIRKTYPATADHGQVYYEQGKDLRILMVMERWQMVGNILVKGKEEFEPEYLPDVERDMEAVFSHMSLQAPSTHEDFAVGPVTVRQLSRGGAESTDANITMLLPVAGGQTVKTRLGVESRVLSRAGSITILARMKRATEGARDAGGEAKVLRASRRSAAGMDGEESALSFAKANSPAYGLRVEWGSPGRPSDDSTPQTELLFGIEEGRSLQGPRLLAIGTLFCPRSDTGSEAPLKSWLLKTMVAIEQLNACHAAQQPPDPVRERGRNRTPRIVMETKGDIILPAAGRIHRRSASHSVHVDGREMHTVQVKLFNKEGSLQPSQNEVLHAKLTDGSSTTPVIASGQHFPNIPDGNFTFSFKTFHDEIANWTPEAHDET